MENEPDENLNRQEGAKEENFIHYQPQIPSAEKPMAERQLKDCLTISAHTAEEIENEFESKEIENEQKVEAALFISGRFLNLEELSMLTELNSTMLKNILCNLQKKYSMGVIRIVNRNESWKMDVSERYHYLINRLAAGNTEFTKAEQETLAVIAYKQPIKQSVVIKIRGNKSYDHIKKFRELGLVVVKKDGHTNELSLSEEFYEYFNVYNKKKEGTNDT
ncbi:MAG: SMC-Scp complex subunit ScpB [Candidatus Pacearchaeota archaeon]